MSIAPRAFAAFCVLLLCACADRAPVPPAQLLVFNANILTMDAAQPRAEAMAVRDGKVVALGTRAELEPLRGESTELRDMGGRTLIPGLIDAHAHPVWGAVKELFACQFAFESTPEQVQAAIAGCVKAQPGEQWIRGGHWTSDFFRNNRIPSPRRFLDEVSGDKAVVLQDDSGHNNWVNTRALELLGMGKDTPDPEGVTFEREADGMPNGVILEGFKVLDSVVPDYADAQYLAAARAAQDHALRRGIVAFKDASASEVEARAYQALDRSGDLHISVALALVLDDKAPFDLPTFTRLRDTYRSAHVDTRFVKLFLDGVPTASRTAAMLQPYTVDDQHPEHTRGSLHVQPADLDGYLTELDRAGFTVKIHAAGDWSVRVALDAIAAARKANGNSGLRHEIAHAGFVDPADLPRFEALSAVADFSPYIFAPSPIIDSVVGAVGERGRQYWPTRALLESSAPMLLGSDWPSAVPSMDPWAGLEALVTRRDPTGKHPGELWPEQAVDVMAALGIFTGQNAAALLLGSDLGGLSVGKRASFAVLDRDVTTVDPATLDATRVLQTWVDGVLRFADAPDSGAD